MENGHIYRARKISNVRSHPRGFTLIEVIIVAVVLVLLATAIVPRMSGVSRRKNDAAFDAVASVIAAFAFHESTNNGQLALSYDNDFRQLELQVLEQSDSNSGQRPIWRIHPFTQPITLPDNMDITMIFSDGEALNPEDFFITTQSSGDRPSIELKIEADDDSATISLTPYALSPVLVRKGDQKQKTIRIRSNLDDMGLEREDW